ncbi:hypothetical protein AVEN_170090-1 [Araneus ventricosus]|uniref:Uncharacterized protein n=1 Tax=Araneus ventricosus TaxID=182803 RepID=A0A4Y2M4S2_ARAVE|nr:hypothetical protein AVEN_170090-1 [Araneus ventricosus]
MSGGCRSFILESKQAIRLRIGTSYKAPAILSALIRESFFHHQAVKPRIRFTWIKHSPHRAAETIVSATAESFDSNVGSNIRFKIRCIVFDPFKRDPTFDGLTIMHFHKTPLSNEI